ncbi:MAG: hypothetical protein O3C60_19970 [Planctomycetota bacterium]|nr:hypothetical protein [Planctomycetota bacterium]
MIVYAQTKARFVQDVRNNRIARVVEQAFLQQLGFVPGQAELSAFQNSLNYVGNVLSDANTEGLPVTPFRTDEWPGGTQGVDR